MSVSDVAHVHTFPIDEAFKDDPLEAWKEICIFGRRVTFTPNTECTWGNVTCSGDECRLIVDER